MSDVRPCHSAAPAITFLGDSVQTQRLRTTIDLVARGDARVLITGESGSGKEIVARCIHSRSSRHDRPFIAVNCGAVTESLIESELFGHVRGSFTDAYRDKAGQLELAHQGTVFLDEIGEMPLRMQAVLLRFLENGEVQRVGSDAAPRQIDVRVIAATNRCLPELVRGGMFREDLLYRLDVVHISVPPLRERRADIRVLLAHHLATFNRPTPIAFADETLAALERYSWPGNVRQLQNVVEQVAWTAPGDVVEPGNLPDYIVAAESAPESPRPERRRQRADDLFEALASGQCQFWDDVRSMFLRRDLTRNDLQQLVRRGLEQTHGNYRALMRLFGLPEDEYKRLLNFLSVHGCQIDFRKFRYPDAVSWSEARARKSGAA